MERVENGPSKSFRELADKSLRKRAIDIVNEYSARPKLLQLIVDLGGKKLKELEEDDDLEEEENDSEEQTDSALAIFLALKLTKRKYIMLRKIQSAKHAIPSYEKLINAKNDCLPENIYADEKVAFVPFQDLLNNTAESILKGIDGYFSPEEMQQLHLIFVYEFDGSSGYKNTHQRFEDESNETSKSELSLFVSSMCPIQVKSLVSGRSWLIQTPQSVRFWRVVRASFEVETTDSILREYERLKEELESLTEHRVGDSRMTFEGHLTALDGKGVNALLGNTRTIACPVCLKTYNQYAGVDIDCPDVNDFPFGLGLLHCYIRTLEFLMQVSYKKPFKKWSIDQPLKGR